jgi:hypothetical protein
MSTTEIMETGLTPAQQALSDLWDEHVRDEFAVKDANAALDTMTPDAYVNHVPVLTGGLGREELREFYAKHYSEDAATPEDRSNFANDRFGTHSGRNDHSVYTHD